MSICLNACIAMQILQAVCLCKRFFAFFCRLLRNRVSAQQARERKKSYVSNLEQRAREQEQSITEMEQRVNKLERENAMLRSVGSCHKLGSRMRHQLSASAANLA